jgi:hypothetical protein
LPASRPRSRANIVRSIHSMERCRVGHTRR